MTEIRLLVAKHAPALRAVRRLAFASRDVYGPARQSYSQHGEDLRFVSELHDWDPSEAIYVDVGANHPTRLSNTYLLYRRGWHGLVVEPDAGLMILHKRFRPRDIQVCAGCGRRAALMPFYVSVGSVLSSFSKQAAKYVCKTEHLPVLTLDQLLEPFADKKIALLSVDTEGLDYDVLLGAEKALERTHLLSVESNDAGSRDSIQRLLERRFEAVGQMGCNVFYRQRGTGQVQSETRGRGGGHIAS